MAEYLPLENPTELSTISGNGNLIFNGVDVLKHLL